MMSPAAFQRGLRPFAGAELRAAYFGRTAIAVAAVLYAFARLGLEAGSETAAAAALFCTLDAIRYAWFARLPAILPEIVIVILQFAVIGVFCYAPSPFGVGSSIPAQVIIDSPVTILLLCYLASNAVASRPQLIWASGVALLVLWLGVWVAAMHDPQVVTRQTLPMARLKTLSALLHALNAPHYFNISLWWKIGLVSTLLITVALGVGLYRIRRLARAGAKQEVRRASLAAFFPPLLVDIIFSARQHDLEPRDHPVTVLDCDLVGFTAKTETMTPEQVGTVLAHYRAMMEDAVFEQDGAVLTHVGDGSISLFGLRENSDTSPRRAIACALTLLRRWDEIAKPLFSGTPPPLALGIDFGPAAVGLVGEDRSLSLLAAGAAVAGAAALQQATREVKTCLLVSEGAWKLSGPLPPTAIFESCPRAGATTFRLVSWT